jgi:hypothetical protein
MSKRTTLSPETLSLSGMFADFRLLLTLFIGFRLILMLVYQPLVIEGVERGLAAGGDFATYYALGELSGQGLFPFRDWWSEFPPIPSLLITALYQLIGSAPRYELFAQMLGFLMLIFDVGNLTLVRRIGTRLHGANTGMTLAWIYALMLAPTIFIWWNFEPMVAFWLLLGLHWLLHGKTTTSALITAIGALTKFTPALLLGAVWRFRPTRHALRYSALVIVLFGVVYGLLLAQNAAMTLPSLTAQFSKSSYQTVWALLDGNFGTGNFGPISDRLDPALATVQQGNPALIPGIVRLAVAALIGAFIYARTRRYDSRGLVAFVAITLLIFFLQTQGWSTQWLAQIIPLLLLALPNRDTVLSIVLLTGTAFAEYPFLFLRTGETGGLISGELTAPYTMLILIRTAILIGFCVALYRKLRQQPVPEEQS